MASLQERKRRGESAFVIQFYLNGKRKSLFLGAKYSRSFAEEICRVVEKVVVALTTGSNVDRRTYAWLESMEVDLRERFESAGLLEPEIRLTLGELFDAYFRAEDSAMRPITFRNKTRSAAIFFELFERSRDVSTFAKSDALRLIAALDRKYAEATRAGVVRDVSRVFSWAVETELLDASPFKGVKRGSFKNKSRETFVDRATYSRLLEASSDQETRTLIALYRIGGLRKSEALCVEWRDVDFATGRMLVHSPKTAGCGRPSRIIPLFPELRAELEALWDLVPEGESRYVIARNRNPNTLRKRIERVVFYAGLPLWERLIQNMRSSRANEIFREFGQIAEREWIDRSTATAQDHYLHILEAEYDRAAGTRSTREKPNARPTTLDEKTNARPMATTFGNFKRGCETGCATEEK
ncbi:MAG: tyrosine-type recombinase/integrase [Thermoguttaceae bacterium]|nr:tyrosine-type recombinase/integrase [Thermoguttaceae bacterium]